MTVQATVIIPAHDEAGYIEGCLGALLASDAAAAFEVVVVANACTDDTAARARAVADKTAVAGRLVRVIETERGGKPQALQTGDDAATAPIRVYLDADVLVSPGLIPALIGVLEGGAPRYASGRPVVAAARSPVTRFYARFWQRLPFFSSGVPGFGLFAVNGAGRARWGAWPDVISDDTFARLQFAPEERIFVDATYRWPMVEGFRPLVRVRRRQDRGVREIARRFPALMRNSDRVPHQRWQKAGAAMRDPAGFAIYALVTLCVKLTVVGGKEGAWERGR